MYNIRTYNHIHFILSANIRKVVCLKQMHPTVSDFPDGWKTAS